jgi:hypothetical protein
MRGRLLSGKPSTEDIPEIEITSEMIEAGARELFLSLPVQDQVDLDGVAVSVFKAMIEAWLVVWLVDRP